MKDENGIRAKIVAVTITFAVLGAAAIAGPPLICHPFDIGTARSLPWGASVDMPDWNAPKIDYDIRQLSTDVISLLGEKTPVIVRMETIRRAALYGLKSEAAAQALLGSLKVRAGQNEGANQNPLFLFDYGYLIETIKQAWLTKKSQGSVCPAASLSGLPYLQEALKLRGNDSQMELAAAIVTAWPRHESHQEHLRKAIAGASRDPLVAKNLTSHFTEADRIAAKTN